MDPPLIELNVGGNYISHQGVQGLINALQINQRLSGFSYSTRSYTNKLSFDILASSVNRLCQSQGTLVRFSLEDSQFNAMTIPATQRNQQRAKSLFKAIVAKNTFKAIKLLDEGVSPFIVDWQCGFKPSSNNMALHWIVFTGNVRLMCEMVARYKYFLHYRNISHQSVLDIIKTEQEKATQNDKYIWLNMQKLWRLNRERLYRILALARILHQPSERGAQFNLFTGLSQDLQSKVLRYLVGGEVSTAIFANIVHYAKERGTLWNEPSQFLRYCLWGGEIKWYQYADWDLSFRQRYSFIEILLMAASQPPKKSMVIQLSAFLNACQLVTVLNLSKKALTYYRVRDVSLITPRCSHSQVVNVMLRLLKINRTLKRVYLGNVLMTAHVIEKLVDVLKANTTLTKIIVNGFDYIPICRQLNQPNCHFSQQNIGDEQGKVIALLLSRKQDINHLNLSGNPLSQQSIKMILWALKDNHHLQSLDLRFSWLDETSTMTLWHLLQENRSLKEVSVDFDLVNKDFKQGIIDELVARRQSAFPYDRELSSSTKVTRKTHFFDLPKKGLNTNKRSEHNLLWHEGNSNHKNVGCEKRLFQ